MMVGLVKIKGYEADAQQHAFGRLKLALKLNMSVTAFLISMYRNRMNTLGWIYHVICEYII